MRGNNYFLKSLLKFLFFHHYQNEFEDISLSQSLNCFYIFQIIQKKKLKLYKTSLNYVKIHNFIENIPK